MLSLLILFNLLCLLLKKSFTHESYISEPIDEIEDIQSAPLCEFQHDWFSVFKNCHSLVEMPAKFTPLLYSLDREQSALHIFRGEISRQTIEWYYRIICQGITSKVLTFTSLTSGKNMTSGFGIVRS